MTALGNQFSADSLDAAALTAAQRAALAKVGEVVMKSADLVIGKLQKRLEDFPAGHGIVRLQELTSRLPQAMARWLELAILPETTGSTRAKLRQVGDLLAARSVPPDAIVTAFYCLRDICAAVLHKASRWGRVAGVPVDKAIAVLDDKLACELASLLSAFATAEEDRKRRVACDGDVQPLLNVARFAQAVSLELDTDGVLGLLVAQVTEQFAPADIVMHKLDAGGDRTMPVVVPGVRQAHASVDWQLCRCLRTGRRFDVSDATTALIKCNAQMCEQSTGSYCCIPLVAGTHVFGCMRLIWPKPNAFDTRQLDFLSLYGQITGMAMRSIELLRANLRNASSDPLTGVSTMRSFMKILAKEQLLLMRRGGCASLLMADIDGLKKINELHGNEAGDRVLQSLAQLLTTSVRRTDEIARCGGDEFALLLRDCRPADALMVAEKIAARIARENISIDEDTNIGCTACIGVAGSPTDAKSLPDAMPLAKAALADAKLAGPGKAMQHDATSSIATAK